MIPMGLCLFCMPLVFFVIALVAEHSESPANWIALMEMLIPVAYTLCGILIVVMLGGSIAGWYRLIREAESAEQVRAPNP